MNTPTTRQFKQCQATIANFDTPQGRFTIFYSYQCPELVEFPGGLTYRFTFDGSRKAGAKTWSRTTAKQCTQYLGHSAHDLPTYSLADFEAEYFDTRLEDYF